MIKVLFEDNHLLVVVKPPNWPVQLDRSGDHDLLNWCRKYIKTKYQKPGEAFVGLVHRLDRPVGGVIVFARTSKAAARLSDQMRRHTMQRTYWAVVYGHPPESATLHDTLIKESRTNTVQVVPPNTPGSQEAILHYRTLIRGQNLTLIEVSLETGRSHQIRVQFANIGYPLWGDARYGNGQPGQQIALWCVAIMFVHPTKREVLRFEALPPDIFPWNLEENP